MINQIPDKIRNLVMGGFCIKNKQNNFLLYENQVDSSKYRRVVIGKKDPSFSNKYILELPEHDLENYGYDAFRLRNDFYVDYISADDEIDKVQRIVFGQGVTNELTIWMLELVNGDESIYRLKNKHYNEYMYTSNENTYTKKTHGDDSNYILKSCD